VQQVRTKVHGLAEAWRKPGLFTEIGSFEASVRLCADAGARQSFVVVLGASFEALPSHQMRVATVPVALHDVDVHYGAPDSSSVRYDADMADWKASSTSSSMDTPTRPEEARPVESPSASMSKGRCASCCQ